MITHLRGLLIEATPTHLIVECGGVGYFLHTTLYTFEAIRGQNEILVYTEHLVREDDEILYGFQSREEREMFRLLISVSGIGATTARMILSAISFKELTTIIASGDVRRLKSVKGIGEKSAQRILLDLKDKVGSLWSTSEALKGFQSSVEAEALAALSALGFSRSVAEKALSRIKVEPDWQVERIIKETLKYI